MNRKGKSDSVFLWHFICQKCFQFGFVLSETGFLGSLAWCLKCQPRGHRDSVTGSSPLGCCAMLLLKVACPGSSLPLPDSVCSSRQLDKYLLSKHCILVHLI